MGSLKKVRKHILSISLMSYAFFLPISHSIVYFPLAIGVVFSVYALTNGRDNISYPAHLKRLGIVMLLLILWQVLTLLLNGADNEALRTPFIRGLDYVYIFALPAVSADRGWKRSIAEKSLFVLLITTSVIIVLGLFQKASGIGYALPRQPFSGEALVGFFGHHIDAGGFFSTLAVLAICLIMFWEKPKNVNMVLVGILVLLVSGLFFSLARTYYVSMLLVVPAILLKKHWRTAIFGILSFALSILVVLSLFPSIKERAFSIADLKHNPSNLERVYLWRTAVDIIHDNPVAGVGFKQWNKGLAEYGKKYSEYWKFTGAASHHAHNLYLSVAAETGIVGLSLFMSFWFYAVYAVFKIADRFPQGSFDRALALGVFSGLINLLLGGMFEVNLLKPQTLLFAAFLVSLSIFTAGAKQDAG
jgi:O-antigen ligase